MLRLGKVATGGHAYYLEVAGGTGTGAEPPGRWLGSGGAVLGLTGEVEEASLDALLRGRHPVDGRVLGTAHHRVRVAAFDLTFCAPKSVSVLHALGPGPVRASVAEGHEAAVEAALQYAERHALGVRRRMGPGGPRVTEGAEGTAVAGFVHRTSRALDPHLHTHVVAANLGRGPDGVWRALDGRGVYAHAGATAAVYHAQLRYELTTRLGVAWGRLDRGRADIAGIGPEARREFSTRSAQIGAHLAARGLAPPGPGRGAPVQAAHLGLGRRAGPRATAIAAHRTRAAKDPAQQVDDLLEWWHRRAEGVGLGPRRLQAVLDRVPRRAPVSPDLDLLRDRVTRDLATARPTATRRDVVRASCARLPAGAPLPWLEEAADHVVSSLEPLHPDHGTSRWRGPGVAEPRLRLEGHLGRERLGLERPGLERSADAGLGLG